MLHPVGDLPAAVYWRRRALVLALLISVVGGGGWVTRALLIRKAADVGTTVAADSAPLRPLPTPALESIEPAVTGVVMPPRYGRCTDAQLAVRVTAPPAAAAGAATTFRLVVTNSAAFPCVRALDRGLQQVVLLDAAGHRIWGSNDCASLAGSDERTLAPRQSVSFPMAWNGLAGGGSCAVPGTVPPAGSYVLRGWLDTVAAPAVPLTLS